MEVNVCLHTEIVSSLSVVVVGSHFVLLFDRVARCSVEKATTVQPHSVAREDLKYIGTAIYQPTQCNITKTNYSAFCYMQVTYVTKVLRQV